MTRRVQIIKLKKGMKDEYKRRHDNIWPELKESMRRQGIYNYSIWCYGELLFSYCEIDEAHAMAPTPEQQKLGEKWAKYTSDIIEFVMDPETGEIFSPEMVFLFEGNKENK